MFLFKKILKFFNLILSDTYSEIIEQWLLLLELVLVETRLCMQNLELKIGLCEKMVISMTDNLLLC